MKNKLKIQIPFLFLITIIHAQIKVTQIATLPVKVTNNAVCEGFIDSKPYVFSFAGIDSTKKYDGIHLKSFRYDVKAKKTTRIADLPDSRGKIACAANRINNIIYISGGYYVYKDGHEVSSNKMHRYDIKQNIFLKNAANIPLATDDHVQAVWNNKLIYLITGWSNKENIPNVQIYDVKKNKWLTGTSIPNQANYKSFGASGTIIGNTIYYFGGATSEKGFKIQNKLRIGKINPKKPTEIKWSIQNTNYIGYRMACTTINNKIHWLGGSNQTYNFNGIAYSNKKGVLPNQRDLIFCTKSQKFKEMLTIKLPMDLRGIANIEPKISYVMGGMLKNQKVTNGIYKIEW